MVDTNFVDQIMTTYIFEWDEKDINFYIAALGFGETKTCSKKEEATNPTTEPEKVIEGGTAIESNDFVFETKNEDNKGKKIKNLLKNTELSDDSIVGSGSLDDLASSSHASTVGEVNDEGKKGWEKTAKSRGSTVHQNKNHIINGTFKPPSKLAAQIDEILKIDSTEKKSANMEGQAVNSRQRTVDENKDAEVEEVTGSSVFLHGNNKKGATNPLKNILSAVEKKKETIKNNFETSSLLETETECLQHEIVEASNSSGEKLQCANNHTSKYPKSTLCDEKKQKERIVLKETYPRVEKEDARYSRINIDQALRNQIEDANSRGRESNKNAMPSIENGYNNWKRKDWTNNSKSEDVVLHSLPADEHSIFTENEKTSLSKGGGSISLQHKSVFEVGKGTRRESETCIPFEKEEKKVNEAEKVSFGRDTSNEKENTDKIFNGSGETIEMDIKRINKESNVKDNKEVLVESAEDEKEGNVTRESEVENYAKGQKGSMLTQKQQGKCTFKLKKTSEDAVRKKISDDVVGKNIENATVVKAGEAKCRYKLDNFSREAMRQTRNDYSVSRNLENAEDAEVEEDKCGSKLDISSERKDKSTHQNNAVDMKKSTEEKRGEILGSEYIGSRKQKKSKDSKMGEAKYGTKIDDSSAEDDLNHERKLKNESENSTTSEKKKGQTKNKQVHPRKVEYEKDTMVGVVLCRSKNANNSKHQRKSLDEMKKLTFEDTAGQTRNDDESCRMVKNLEEMQAHDVKSESTVDNTLINDVSKHQRINTDVISSPFNETSRQIRNNNASSRKVECTEYIKLRENKCRSKSEASTKNDISKHQRKITAQLRNVLSKEAGQTKNDNAGARKVEIAANDEVGRATSVTKVQNSLKEDGLEHQRKNAVDLKKITSREVVNKTITDDAGSIKVENEVSIVTEETKRRAKVDNLSKEKGNSKHQRECTTETISSTSKETVTQTKTNYTTMMRRSDRKRVAGDAITEEKSVRKKIKLFTPRNYSKKKANVTPHLRNNTKIKMTYNHGGNGRICDVCFEPELSGCVCSSSNPNPFIKCSKCKLLVHIQCYEPNSWVDAAGHFLCDVCSYLKGKENTPEKKVPFSPGPLPADVEWMDDGRLHPSTPVDIFCTFCLRRDVVGGMKRTGERPGTNWAHLSCSMSTEHTFFRGGTMLGVNKALRLNSEKIDKEWGSTARCEICTRQGGFLLNCSYFVNPLEKNICTKTGKIQKQSSYKKRKTSGIYLDVKNMEKNVEVSKLPDGKSEMHRNYPKKSEFDSNEEGFKCPSDINILLSDKKGYLTKVQDVKMSNTEKDGLSKEEKKEDKFLLDFVKVTTLSDSGDNDIKVLGKVIKLQEKKIGKTVADGFPEKKVEVGKKAESVVRCRCPVFMHPLCAELSDRERTITPSKLGDVILFKCALHSGFDKCARCGEADQPNKMLECDGCKKGYHMFCLTPPLQEAPETEWLCHLCSKKN